MSFRSGYISPFIGACLVLTVFVHIAESACRVTHFDSGRSYASYTFCEGQPGSLKANVSDRDLFDSVYWTTGALLISQDSFIIANYAKNYTLIVNETTGLYELVFKNNLKAGDAGIYRCSCGSSSLDAAVFVKVSICQSILIIDNTPDSGSNVTIDNETVTDLPGVIFESIPGASSVREIDFDAGPALCVVFPFRTSWTCISKLGNSVDGTRLVSVTPHVVDTIKDCMPIYRGGTACFDIINHWSGSNRSHKNCTVIDATFYDSCKILVNDVVIVNYTKNSDMTAETATCQVTEFGGTRTAPRYSFDETGPGSLRANISGKSVTDCVSWMKGDHFLSQDNSIVTDYADDFSLASDEGSGLYELKFKNNLTAEDAGVYNCSCGDSHLDVAVFVNVGIQNSTSVLTINNETGDNVPTRRCGLAPPAVLQIDFDAGSIYPAVHFLKSSWTCISKSGKSSNTDVMIPVTPQPDSRYWFKGVYETFSYKGVTACFDLVVRWNGPHRSIENCTVINAGSYDSCWLFLNGHPIVNYKKHCIASSAATTTTHLPVRIGIIIGLLVILVAGRVGNC